MLKQSNILDPIHNELDADVWDYPDSAEPILRHEHKRWITETVYKYLDDAGYDGMDDWLSLVFTGSLTTYQYSEKSDVDISLFVDTMAFPDWSRAEMIGVMVNHIDGTTVPGTSHPIQCFVVPPDVTKADLYQPGLRSGYDLATDTWIQPPESDRVHDVEKEMNTSYMLALESADKMELLLKYEPQEAVRYWHYIHDKRREDQKEGKGDFAPSNIVYKMIANRGLFDPISEVSGEYIAKAAGFDEYEQHVEKLEELENRLKDLERNFAIRWPELSYEQLDELKQEIAAVEAEYETAQKEYAQFYYKLPRYKDQGGSEMDRLPRVARPVSDDWWENRYNDADKKLFHGTHLNALDFILGRQEGIVPWDDEEKAPGTLYADWVRPRPGHTYMGQSLSAATNASQMAGADWPIALQIDPKHLDPQLVNPDEDALYDFDDEKWDHRDGLVTHPKPEHGDQSNYESLGDWAEAVNLGQNPDATARLLEENEDAWSGLAYRGSVPFHAIEGVWVAPQDEAFYRRYPEARPLAAKDGAPVQFIPVENLGLQPTKPY